MEGMKRCTKAGTGCGGCIPLVKDLINESLKKQGKAINQAICEHFQYSRQELYDLIRVKEIRTFEEALLALGKGGGCEVCKPAIASILASIWNELIIRQATIQDTNDRYLANIQTGGTYSVVPRIPGGEITPDKLIAIGEIAKKYNLYCKITGGQRIDLLGAYVHQLPQIWEELIATGFESGHAYGKSVRTVKSCL
jgi:nitrite reductase (NADH) large subunit